MLARFTDIPKLFKSDLTGGLFDTCVSCGCKLLTNEEGYFIEKALKPYRGLTTYSTVFEYGMCMTCMETMRSELSEESRKKVDAYFLEKIDFHARMELVQNDEDPSVDDLIANCVVYGDKVEDLSECQIIAQCMGDQLVIQAAPYMIGNRVSDDVLALLSKKSLGDLDDFKDRLTGGTPEFMELLEKKKVFI